MSKQKKLRILTLHPSRLPFWDEESATIRISLEDRNEPDRSHVLILLGGEAVVLCAELDDVLKKVTT